MRPWPLKNLEMSFPRSANRAIASAETGLAGSRVFFIQSDLLSIALSGRVLPTSDWSRPLRKSGLSYRPVSWISSRVRLYGSNVNATRLPAAGKLRVSTDTASRSLAEFIASVLGWPLSVLQHKRRSARGGLPGIGQRNGWAQRGWGRVHGINPKQPAIRAQRGAHVGLLQLPGETAGALHVQRI